MKLSLINRNMLFLPEIFKVLFIRKNSRLLFVLFVPVYFFIAQSSLQNRHTHISANGIVVIHSHPVAHTDHEPINAHDHSDSEIYFYHLVHFDYFSLTSGIHIPLQTDSQREKFRITDENNRQQFSLHRNFSRGPPLFSILFA